MLALCTLAGTTAENLAAVRSPGAREAAESTLLFCRNSRQLSEHCECIALAARAVLDCLGAAGEGGAVMVGF